MGSILVDVDPEFVLVSPEIGVGKPKGPVPMEWKAIRDLVNDVLNVAFS